MSYSLPSLPHQLPELWKVLTALVVVLPSAAWTLTFPHVQALRGQLGCDAMCVGTMTSASSAFALIGAPLVGALSDRRGRRLAFVIGCLGNFMSTGFMCMNSLTGIWLAVLAPAFFSHNFTVAKAFVADCTDQSERAGTMGKLGACFGAGVVLGTALQQQFSSFQGAMSLRVALDLFALISVFALPRSAAKVDNDTNGDKKVLPSTGIAGFLRALWEMVRRLFWLSWAAATAAKVLIAVRFFLSLGFHVFHIFAIEVLTKRFEFKSTDYAIYFAVLGTTYGLTQFLLAGPAVRWAGDNPTRLTSGCIIIMSIGRLIFTVSHSRSGLYTSLLVTVLGLGILNTAVSTALSRVKGSQEDQGSLNGLTDTAEKVAGVIGPLIGGLMFQSGSLLPAYCVVGYYMLLALLILIGYPRLLLPGLEPCRAKVA